MSMRIWVSGITLLSACVVASPCLAHPGHGPGGAAGSTYADAIASIDASIAAFLNDAAKQPTSWSPLESAANAWLERAHLSGSYDDFAHADTLFARAFVVAPKGSGPMLSRAIFDLSIHRLDAAEAMVHRQEGAAILTANTKLAIDAARADLAFERGDYPTAKKLIDRLAGEDRSSTNSFRLANYEWHLGDMGKADRLLVEAESLYAGPSDQYRAWFRAQRGDLALDRGRYDEALARYREAEELFSGWWSNYARTARVFALNGQREQAIFAYQDLISRTNSPEMMDALAELYAATDDSIPQKRWTEKARKLHLAREARFPEAAVGHELQHYLRLEADPREAVGLAERNRDLRPNGDAWTWLAQAYLRAGDATRAGTAIDRALTLGWKTPEALATASLVRTAQGKKSEALRLENEARAKNPDAIGLVSWLAPAH